MKVSKGPGVGRDVLAKRLADLQSKQAAVGWFSTAKYPAADGKDAVPVAYVATIQEFGYPEGGIPARSFVRSTQAEKQKGWSVLLAKGSSRVMEGKMTAEFMYDALGLQVAGDIRKTLATAQFQDLADSTVAARARERGVSIEEVNKDPLHDTGYMQTSLTNQTTEKDAAL
jgi:hypothetical protein